MVLDRSCKLKILPRHAAAARSGPRLLLCSRGFRIVLWVNPVILERNIYLRRARKFTLSATILVITLSVSNSNCIRNHSFAKLSRCLNTRLYRVPPCVSAKNQLRGGQPPGSERSNHRDSISVFLPRTPTTLHRDSACASNRISLFPAHCPTYFSAWNILFGPGAIRQIIHPVFPRSAPVKL
jgi:hypothetical protein